jgi:multidrug efflux pump subunit AcrA (membrane-fusion protein)
MKRMLSVVTVSGALLLGILWVAGCGGKETQVAPTRAPGAVAPAPAAPAKGAAETAKPAKVVYTCPMHPEVTSDKPGKCPKCGMDLVPKKT